MHTSAVLTTAYLNTDYLIIILSAYLGLKSDTYAHRFILCTQYFTNILFKVFGILDSEYRQFSIAYRCFNWSIFSQTGVEGSGKHAKS